jgi:hypothetical protein
MRARGVVAIPRVEAPAPEWIRPARDTDADFAHVRLKRCSDLLTVPMPALTSTPIREAASKARAESGSVAAGRDALDSPGPDFHRFRFVFLQFLGERVDIVSLGIDRKPFDLHTVFNDDLHVFRQRFGGGEKSYVGHMFGCEVVKL